MLLCFLPCFASIPSKHFWMEWTAPRGERKEMKSNPLIPFIKENGMDWFHFSFFNQLNSIKSTLSLFQSKKLIEWKRENWLMTAANKWNGNWNLLSGRARGSYYESKVEWKRGSKPAKQAKPSIPIKFLIWFVNWFGFALLWRLLLGSLRSFCFIKFHFNQFDSTKWLASPPLLCWNFILQFQTRKGAAKAVNSLSFNWIAH